MSDTPKTDTAIYPMVSADFAREQERRITELERELAEAGRAIDYANDRKSELEATIKELRAAATDDRKRIEELQDKVDDMRDEAITRTEYNRDDNY